MQGQDSGSTSRIYFLEFVKTIEIRYLPEIPVMMIDAAIRKMAEPGLDETQKGYLRRLVTACIYKIIGFEFNAPQFDGMELPLNSAYKVPEAVLTSITTSFQNFKNYCNTRHDSEARFRSLFIDNGQQGRKGDD